MKTIKKTISVILLLGIVGSAFADVDWNNGGGDRRWDNAANWWDNVTLTARVPGSGDKGAIRQGGVGPIIDSSTAAVANVVVCGDWGHTDSLDITGGSLTTNSWIILGYGASDDGTFNVSGGTTTCHQNLHVGFMGAGHMNMTAGTITVTSTFGIATNGGPGHAELGGGTISCGSFSMTTGATMSITNTGTLVVNGDATAAINSYISNGWLTGYGGSGTLSVDLNVTTTGKTTVAANTPEKAAYPSPGNGAIDASVYSDLSWTPGIYATSHDVYFGTDATPDASEFQGNQTETTFDPGILDLNTTCYWRIDEVDTDNPESPWTGVVWSFKTQATSSFGKIIYPFNATTAIVKAGESFEVWFDADPGQIVNSVGLHGPYNTVSTSMGTPVTGSWVYDTVSGNTYDTQVTVTVPSTAPADRYDVILNTSYGQAISRRAVKVIKEYETDYSILHISDSHLSGGTSAASLLKISQIAKVANILGPEMVFITGDVINWTSGDFQSRVDLFYDGYEPLDIKGMHGFDAATFSAVGNHDFTEGSGESFSGSYDSKSRFWNKYHGLQYHHFEYGNTRCMVVNTGWAGYDYEYQLTDHTSWLGAVGSGNLRIAAYHQAEGGIMGAFANNVNLGLAMIGHNHHLAPNNPYELGGRPIQYFANSIREYLNFNLYRVNSDGSYTVVNNVEAVENRTADPSLWIRRLTLTYANANDGTSSTNTATLDNNFGVSFPRARVRFVIPKGAPYTVSQGIVEQAFDGDSVRVVDVRVAINANSTTSIEIRSSEVPEGGLSDVLVGTYYYPWFDNSSFNGGSPAGSNTLVYHLDPQITPELGWYNQNDPSVISQHYQWGRYAGIDFFVCSYWGMGSRTDNIIQSRMFNNPDRGDVKLCVFMEPSITPRGGATETTITAETNYLCDNYFNQPGYFRIDDKPVIFIYVTRAMTDAELTLCINAIRTAAANKGIGEVYIAGDEVWGSPNASIDGPRVSQLDAVSNYDIYGNLGRARFVTDSKLDTWQSRNASWKSLTDSLGKEFIPAISPGYNDRAVRDGHSACSRKLNDETNEFGSFFSGMIDRLDPTANMVMITSWNEWHEDTQIEPTTVAAPTNADDASGHYTEGLYYHGYGTLYLDILREYFVSIDGIPIGASARGDNPPNETADKAFDGDAATKRLDFSSEGSWIQYRYADGATAYINEYAITSANDFPQRDPRDWNLLGSNDGINWDTLDSRTGVTFASRFETQDFSVTSPGAYNIYRLEITAVNDVATANSVQLAEIELLTCFGLADFNCDEIIDLDDLSYMAGVWLTNDSKADIAHPADGQVNLPDFSILAQKWLLEASVVN